ncbi:MAG: NAD(+) diphosphatase [Tissierellia bacterium]|nr:NAD(+) diphosphatase [Tissierellia bacterium]
MNDYLKFEPSVKPLHKDSREDYWYLFKDNKLMVLKEKGEVKIPRWKDVDVLNISIYNIQSMGSYYNCNCKCGEIIDDINEENIEFLNLRTLSTLVDEESYLLASKANLLLNWLKLNQYCGVCGSKMYKKDSKFERAMVCSNCGNTTWPRTSPAIIVAVTKGDRLLLAHNKYFPEGKYSVIAGFVEYGETFEDCVKREVFEEVGIKIKNIKYFGSQPWPYPNSMMIGFTAEYLDGDIKVDGEEILHADWFTKEEVLGLYNKSISIGSELIEWFLKNH